MFRGEQPAEKVEQSEGPEQDGFSAERRMQETSDASPVQYNSDGSYEREFRSKQGENFSLRVEGNGDQKISQVSSENRMATPHGIRIRSYDSTEAQSEPVFKGKGECGRANLTLEINRDHLGQEQGRRLRLNDIESHPNYRGHGIGSEMIQEAEQIGTQRGASEIYGTLSYELQDEAAVRSFYRKHGYGLRPGSGGGEEVWKSLEQDTDAAALRRQFRQ